MDLILSLIIVMLVVVLIVLFVTQPFTSHRRMKIESSQALSSLLAERDRVLTALKELDFDNSLGKIPVESYPQQRLSLVEQGAQILRDIDRLAPLQAPAQEAPVQEPVPAPADDPVEAILSARRLSRPLQPVMIQAGNEDGDPADEAEKLVASRRKIQPDEHTTGKPAAGMFCPHCGRLLRSDDRFCPGCGQPVQ